MGEEEVVGGGGFAGGFVGDVERGEGSDLGDGGERVGVRVAEGVGGDYEAPAGTRRRGGGGEGQEEHGGDDGDDRETSHNEGRREIEIGGENWKRYCVCVEEGEGKG